MIAYVTCFGTFQRMGSERMGKLIDLTGKRFGRLTVIKRGENKWNHPAWICLCDCGNEVHVLGDSLRNGSTNSCGCFRKEVTSKLKSTHCMSSNGKRHRLYSIWAQMKNRCYNPNVPAYKYYGDRGITICDEWKDDFIEFYTWAISNGYQDNLSIDRIDVNGGYCPENCRWADAVTQANNTRSNRMLTLNGKTQTLAEWCRELNLDYRVMEHRAWRGWSDEEVLTTPVKQR